MFEDIEQENEVLKETLHEAIQVLGRLYTPEDEEAYRVITTGLLLLGENPWVLH